MKKSAIFFLSAILAASCMIPAQAAEYTALTGTPEVDGKLDEIYTQSGSVVLSKDTAPFYKTNDDALKSDQGSTTYFLHDDDYVYFCTVMTDSTPVDTGIKDSWKADAVELWFNVGASGNQKVSVDAFGTKVYGVVDAISVDKCKFAATQGDATYTIEYAIPKSDFKKSPIPFSVQINDCLDKEATTIAARGSQGVGDTLKLSDEKVVVKKVEEKKEETAAQTADMGLIASITAMAASAAVIFKKKH